MNVGTISTTYGGDAGPLQAALAKATASMNQQNKVTDILRVKLGATSKAATDMGAATSSAAAKGAAALPRVTEAAAKAESKMALLQKRAGDVDSKMGKLQVAIGGVSQAFGLAGGKVGALVGGVADAAMAFSSGGPLLAGAVAVGVAVSAAASHFDLFGTKAEEAARKAASHFDDLKREIADLDDALSAMATGTTIEVIKQRAIVAGKDTAARSAVDEFGGAARFTRFSGYEANGIQMSKKDAEAFSKALGALNDYALENEKLTKILRNSQLAKHLEDEADATRDLAAAKKAQANHIWSTVPDEFKPGGLTPAPAPPDLPTIPFAGVYDATQVEIDDMNAHFVGVDDAAIHLADTFNKTNDKTRSLHQGFGDLAVAIAGGGAAGVGSMALGATGSAVSMALGDPTGAIGGAIGSLLGNVLGGTLDELVESLGVLKPLFDGISVVIGAMTPVLLVVGELMTVLGDALGRYAVMTELWAEPLAAVLLIVVRLAEALLPLVEILFASWTGVSMFLGVITAGALIVTEALRTWVTATRNAYNGVVDLVNGMVLAIRSWGGPFEHFGKLLKGVSTHVDSFGAELDGLGASVDAAAASFDGYAENVPTGYFVPNRPTFGAGTDGGAASGQASPWTGGGTQIAIGTLVVKAGNRSVSEVLRDEIIARRGRGLVGVGGEDDTN